MTATDRREVRLHLLAWRGLKSHDRIETHDLEGVPCAGAGSCIRAGNHGVLATPDFGSRMHECTTRHREIRI